MKIPKTCKKRPNDYVSYKTKKTGETQSSETTWVCYSRHMGSIASHSFEFYPFEPDKLDYNYGKKEDKFAPWEEYVIDGERYLYFIELLRSHRMIPRNTVATKIV